VNALETSRLRLYAPKPLSDDERRDPANRLDAIMHGVITTPLPFHVR
jgi:hypothetical protein